MQVERSGGIEAEVATLPGLEPVRESEGRRGRPLSRSHSTAERRGWSWMGSFPLSSGGGHGMADGGNFGEDLSCEPRDCCSCILLL